MKCRFEFVIELPEEDAQKIREQITDSCVWQVKLTSFFHHYFGVRVSGIHQFKWWSIENEQHRPPDAEGRTADDWDDIDDRSRE